MKFFIVFPEDKLNRKVKIKHFIVNFPRNIIYFQIIFFKKKALITFSGILFSMETNSRTAEPKTKDHQIMAVSHR